MVIMEYHFISPLRHRLEMAPTAGPAAAATTTTTTTITTVWSSSSGGQVKPATKGTTSSKIVVKLTSTNPHLTD